MTKLQVTILVTVLFVAPWLTLAITTSNRPDPFLIAVPAENRDLSAQVAVVFSKAPFFILADLRTSTARAIKNPTWRARDTLGLRAAYLLLDEGVGAVLVKSIRPSAHNALYSRGVHVYDGNAYSVFDAIQRFKSGQLADLGQPKLPHHIDASHIPLLAAPCPCLAPVNPLSAPVPHSYGAQATDIPSVGVRIISGVSGGVTVIGVFPDSPAHRAGLQNGDVIVGVGQTTVQDASHFQRLTAIARNSGMMLTVERNGTAGRVWINPAHTRLLPNQVARR